MNKNDRMIELIDILNKASEAYYAKDEEIMSNYEYDALYDELCALESELGITLANSPTVNVGYEAVKELPKEAHAKPMLSLGKTKDREELKNWLNGHEALLSWKLDGLTIVLTYSNGELIKAVTRGNGEVGEVITANARAFTNIPVRIAYKGELIVRGEAVISYSDFEKINNEIKEDENKYKNPRNLCSGSVRQLSSEITAKRHVQFHAFSLVTSSDNEMSTVSKQFDFLKAQGFTVVEYKTVDENTILDAISSFEEDIKTYDIPSDGLVLTYNDIAYGKSLGMTAKFPRNAIAFKWSDEIRETVLLEVEWSASRTGLINPVAIFEPVELEGTTVSRASLHNISYIESMKLGIGDKVTVYKANMIIPQIAENLTKSGTLDIPAICPVCAGATKIKSVSEAKSLYCTNETCPAKKIKSFEHFVTRNAMNIEGLSEATLEKFIALGFIHEYADIYHLDQYKDEIVTLDGFGEKSYENLWSNINKSRVVPIFKLVNALGINNIGLANAKVLCKFFDNDFSKLRVADTETISSIDGMGDVIAASVRQFFDDDKNKLMIDNLLKEIEFEAVKASSDEQNMQGLIFVITGSLNGYSSRNELKDIIEARGGKVTGSVTGKTTALINNDATSSSSKNKKARELGVLVITEEEFVNTYLK